MTMQDVFKKMRRKGFVFNEKSVEADWYQYLNSRGLGADIWGSLDFYIRRSHYNKGTNHNWDGSIA